MKDFERVIIIGGMARTGTTALAAYLVSHPDVLIAVGTEKKFFNLAEGNLLRIECGPPDCRAIKKILMENPDKRIIVKQPWISLNIAFLGMVMGSGGKVIICMREKKELLESWKKTTHISQYTKDHPDKVFDDRVQYDLWAIEEGAYRLDYHDINPSLGSKIGNYLGLNPDLFQSDRLMKRWEYEKEREWLTPHSVAQDRMMWLCGNEKQGG